MKLPVRCRHAMSVSAPPRPPCHLAAALAEMAAHHHRPLALDFVNFDMILSVSESSLHCFPYSVILSTQRTEKVMWRSPIDSLSLVCGPIRNKLQQLPRGNDN